MITIKQIFKFIKYLMQIPEMRKEIMLLRTILEKSIDITKIPKATGNLRKVQLIKTNLLQIVDIILKKYNLTYWLEYGTLIGAIRHKGFIPWDDDIDLCMLKEDYLKLPEILEKELENTDLTVKFCSPGGSQLIRVYYKTFAIDFFPMEYINKQCNSTKEKEDFVNKWLSVKTSLFKNKKLDDFIQNRINHFDIMLEADELKRKIIDEDYSQNYESKQIIRSVETMTTTDLCAVFDLDNIFPLENIDFEWLKLPTPKNPLQHLYESNEYGEYGAVMNFPTIKDAGLYHTQENYNNTGIDYDMLLNEISKILDKFQIEKGK